MADKSLASRIDAALERPVHMSHDHETTDDDDYIDQMAMDSFPASDPPSFSPTTMGTPLREVGASVRDVSLIRSSGHSTTFGAFLLNLGSICNSATRLAVVRVRSTFE